jgi:Ca2+/H+ antiporter
MSKLHKATVLKTVNSASYALSNTFRKEMKKNFTYPVCAFLVPFIVGYSLFISIENTWGVQSLIIVSILILLVVFSALTGSDWSIWFKNSALHKFFKFIWE